MKTTWTLELKGDRAQRAARGLTRDLRSLQSALEQVDGASLRLNATLGRAGPVAASRRVAGERQVARAARQTNEAQRLGLASVAQDLRTQQRIRAAVDRAQRTNAAREARDARRQQGERDRAWRREMRDRGRVAVFQQRLDDRAAARAERQRREGLREHQQTRRDQRELFTGALGVVGTIASTAAAITAVAGAMVVGFAQVGVEIGRWILQMAVFRESAVTTLGAVLGGRGSRGRGSIQQVGAAAYRRAQATARLTPADEAGAIEAATQIAAAGYTGRQAERANAASLDVQALRGSLDPTAQQRFVLGLSQLRGSTRARQEDIRQTATAAGLGVQNVERRAANLAGVTQNRGETDLAYQRRIDAARLSGRITGRIAEEAVLQELQSVTGNRLGGFAAERGSSLGGALSNLEGAPLGMITSIALENLPGLNALKTSLFAIGNALNGSSESGQRLQRAIAGILDVAGATFGSIFSPRNVEAFVSGLADFLPQMVEVARLLTGPMLQGFLRGLGPVLSMFSAAGENRDATLAFFQQLAEALGYIVGVSARITVALAGLFAVVAVLGGGLVQMFDAIISAPMRLLEALAGLQATVAGLATGIGTALVDGIRAGITNAIGTVRETVTGFAGTIVDTARGALGIRSPSRVFAELGGYSAQGFAMGLERGAPDVSAAVSGMLSAPRTAPGAARGPVSITINVDGRGDADELAETIARRVADLFAGELDLAAQAVG